MNRARDIKNQIRTELHQNRYPHGTRLPSERLLARRFATTAATVRKALHALVDEGNLVAKERQGFFSVEGVRLGQGLFVMADAWSPMSTEFLRLVMATTPPTLVGTVAIPLAASDFDRVMADLEIIFPKLAFVVFFQCPELAIKAGPTLATKEIPCAFIGSAHGFPARAPGLSRFLYDEGSVTREVAAWVKEKEIRVLGCVVRPGSPYSGERLKQLRQMPGAGKLTVIPIRVGGGEVGKPWQFSDPGDYEKWLKQSSKYPDACGLYFTFTHLYLVMHRLLEKSKGGRWPRESPLIAVDHHPSLDFLAREMTVVHFPFDRHLPDFLRRVGDGLRGPGGHFEMTAPYVRRTEPGMNRRPGI